MSEHLKSSTNPMSDTKRLTFLPPEQTTSGPTDFSFVYRGIPFTGHRDDTSEDGVLRLVGDIGPLPYSAEAPVARVGISAIVMHANNLLGTRFRVHDQRILVFGSITAKGRPSANRMVSVAAAFLIPLSPYLELLDVYLLPNRGGIRPEWRRNRHRVAAPPKIPALSAPGR